MDVKFSWDISFGQVIVTVPIIWVMIMLMRMYNMLLNFRIEHEDLMVRLGRSTNATAQAQRSIDTQEVVVKEKRC